MLKNYEMACPSDFFFGATVCKKRLIRLDIYGNIVIHY